MITTAVLWVIDSDDRVFKYTFSGHVTALTEPNMIVDGERIITGGGFLDMPDRVVRMRTTLDSDHVRMEQVYGVTEQVRAQ